MTDGSIETVERFIALHYPAADAALLAGSQARGQGSIGSDVDVVLLFGSLPDGAWREMTLFEGRYLEVFAHDLSTLAYFFRRVDRPSGIPALPAMVSEAIVVVARSQATLDAAKAMATQTLTLGPEPLDENALRAGRFAITELAAALHPDRNRHVLLAAGAALYVKLADFALRAEGHWSGSGKALPHALSSVDPKLANQFESAFTALMVEHNTSAVQALVDSVLARHGGRLRNGFRQLASPEWRETPICFN